MSGCFNVNGMIGTSEFLPTPGSFLTESYGNYYHQPYYNRQHHHNHQHHSSSVIDGLSPVDIDTKRDIPTYEDYAPPEVASYGMPPSLFNSTTPYYEDKFRVADGGVGGVRFNQRLSFASVSPSNVADQFSAFTDSCLSSVISPANQNAINIDPRPSENLLANSSVTEFLPIVRNVRDAAPDGCDATNGNDSTASCPPVSRLHVVHPPVTSQTSNSLLSFPVQVASAASCNGSVGSFMANISSLNSTGKTTNNGKYTKHIKYILHASLGINSDSFTSISTPFVSFIFKLT